MHASKEQFERYLIEEKQSLHHMASMVPENREDWPLMKAELDTIEEIISIFKETEWNAFLHWLKNEQQQCEAKIQIYDESIYPIVGRNVVFKSCLKWLKKDHSIFVNNIYLD